MKSSRCTTVLLCAASAIKYSNNLVDAVEDHELLFVSVIYISLLKQIPAFSSSRPPNLFSSIFIANLVGIISYVGSGISSSENVPLSKSPVISALIASPHYSLVC